MALYPSPTARMTRCCASAGVPMQSRQPPGYRGAPQQARGCSASDATLSTRRPVQLNLCCTTQDASLVPAVQSPGASGAPGAQPAARHHTHFKFSCSVDRGPKIGVCAGTQPRRGAALLAAVGAHVEQRPGPRGVTARCPVVVVGAPRAHLAKPRLP